MISFLQIPLGLKVPGAFVEFDTSKARQGVAIKVFNALLIGSRLAAGSKPEKQIDIVTSPSQARDFYGKGSVLFHMAKAFIGENGGLNELNCISLDNGAAVAAQGSYEVLTQPTAAGILDLMIGGRRYRVNVAATDLEPAITTALIDLVNADEDSYVLAAVDGGNADKTIFTAKNGGELSNDLDIRENYFGGELPTGLTSAIVAMGVVTAGVGNPDITDIIAAMGETQYDVIAMPYNDAANLLLMQTELQDRWAPIRQNDGHLFVFRKESFADFSAHLDTRNNEQETVMGIAGPTPQWEWSANCAADVAEEAQKDSARPFQTVPMTQVLAPREDEEFSFGERNQLLQDGGSTYTVDSSGIVRIERLRTTRIENEFAAPDEALADLNPKLTVSFLRFDFRVLIATKYPRHKLADDGTRFAPGQAIITPLVGKAEAVNRFRLWEELGLVEGGDQFKRDLIVERNKQDVNRLDFLLPPDLINQLRVVGVQIGFLL